MIKQVGRGMSDQVTQFRKGTGSRPITDAVFFSIPGPMPSRSVQLHLINDAPGIQESNVADNVANLNFQFFIPAIPTTSTWGCLMLGVSVVLLALVWSRRSGATRSGEC
jgi:hypothetical protein